MGVTEVSRQSSGVGGGGYKSKKILSGHFEKYLRAIKLELTGLVRITFFLLLEKNEILVFSILFFIKILNFHIRFDKNYNFQTGSTL